ncbi:MAG: MBL fold metallo-hydrolase [Bacteroidales bacterium]|nr:MBL fold metallo-hydrolase [Bacteroidales bacterium]
MLRTRIFQFNPLGTNCIVCWASGSSLCAVFDPGMSHPADVEQLTAFLQEHSLTPEAILLTHGHFDHVWGVNALQEKYPVPVYMNGADREILERGASIFAGIPALKSLKVDFSWKELPDSIICGGVSWKVLRTPGHTPGGVCYYSEENSLLISGDTLFAGAIGRTDLVGGDYDAIMRSILGTVMVLPGDTDVIPGHGQPTSIAREAASNPFLEPFNEPLPDND